MKLRLRSLESKQTHKIDVADPCTLHQLKQTLFNTLNSQNPSSSSSSSPFESIHLSLNRKDDLHGASLNGEETLRSLGITSGDLIFFTLNPSRFSLPEGQAASGEAQNSQIAIQSPPDLEDGGIPTSDETRNSHNALESAVNLQSEDAQEGGLTGNEEGVVDAGDYMEVDDDAYEGNVGNSFSAPGFLRKVFTEELGSEADRHHELIVIAIHAVLLESGFVAFDPVSKMEIKGFQFRNNWPSGSFALSLYYTLPEIVHNCPLDSNCTVVLKFVSLCYKSMNVYGSLTGPKSVVHKVNFDENKLVPFLNVVWANCSVGDEIAVREGVSGTSPEKEVFEFWRNVKDKLALPLLIDLCEKAGLMLPVCFRQLPTELKLKILEFLPGVDVAKVSCVCSELRYLSSSDDLWKKKYAEQFGDAGRAGEGGYWKQKFVNSWETRKGRRVLSRVSVHRAVRPFVHPRMPPIIGGDEDIWPHLGIAGGDYVHSSLPFVRILPPPGGGMPPVRRLGSQVPRCNLGGSSNRTFI